MEKTLVKKCESIFDNAIARLLGLLFAVVLVVLASSLTVSADATLVDSGDTDDYSYALYSDGGLELTVKFEDSRSYTFIYLKDLSCIPQVKNITVDITGYDGRSLHINGAGCNTTGITGITFVNTGAGFKISDLYIRDLSKLNSSEIVFPEGTEIEKLMLCSLDNLDSFDFLSGCQIDTLGLTDFFEVQKADLSLINANNVNISWCKGFTEIHLPDNCESAYIFMCEALKTCYIPSSFKYAESEAYSIAGSGSDGGLFYTYCFDDCNALSDIYYAGSSTEFDGIKVVRTVGRDQKEIAEDVSFRDQCGDAVIHYYNGLTSAWFKKADDSWLYLDKNGDPVTGWQQIGGNWYCFDEKGIMQTGWIDDGGIWYYLASNGKMKTGWQKIGGVWYYFGTNGKMRTDWQSVGGKWYYFGDNGKMRTSWQKLGGVWYYFDASGAMVTGWKSIGGVYYYFKTNGVMAAGEYCGGYRLDADGRWTYTYKASWKKDSKGWWYGDSNGWYAKNETRKIDGKDYNFDKSGYCTNP